MKYDFYLKGIDFFRSHRWLRGIICFCARWLPLCMAAAYALFFLNLLIHRDVRIILYLLIPAFVFAEISIMRNKINRPRPYDTLGFTPLLPFKPGKGKSFPSRHTASAWIIALAVLSIDPIFGSVMIFGAILISLGRIFTGMHYPSDVAAAILNALIIGILGFFV